MLQTNTVSSSHVYWLLCCYWPISWGSYQTFLHLKTFSLELGRLTQSVRFLYHKHKDLSSGHHSLSISWTQQHTTVIPALEKWGQRDPSGLLTSPLSQMVSSRFSERSCLKNKRVVMEWWRKTSLTSAYMCTYMHRTYMCTHIQHTHTQLQKLKNNDHNHTWK